MFLIDTNVISELMRSTPAPSVLNWFSTQDPSTLYLSAVTEAELRTGIAILPAGQRRAGLRAALDATISEDFEGRILPFDTDAAKTYAEIAAARRASGRPIADADCQIAAIARAMGASVVTRNVKDFAGCGVEILDPWSDRRD
ncbi:type II toxin-antitoxin system VapC family toxin [Rhodobacter capsulatus]|uniref:type II toxin-antitoxin system VapC family toxin n=1 Tax=Rhodobacter capsulatus TaxID=1061 RepID=UPI001145172C|nr:type II toxin-antitoxin system VapC family toxin [Rhodobacter capsulatus]TQD35583.1 type II toxin-antitoxin system VapC family toxin [Rhodobacter capsulatus]